MALRKGLTLDEIANLLRELFEVGSNLDSDEDIRLNERNCKKSKESADVFSNIPVNSYIYVDMWMAHRMSTT
ncbi:hypothetical protein TNCV_2786251 [Trichonephila clavipes]|nr:hypothetical protein TNCV_2786251 [Trichonephila clavipes]